MPVRVEQLPGEPIIVATIMNPFVPEEDMPAMYSQFISLRRNIPGYAALIIDVRETMNDPAGFSQMMLAMAEASRGIKAGQAAGLSGPPRLIMVGEGPMAGIAAEGMAQEQYGGVKGEVCPTLEEAIERARVHS